MGQRMCGWSKQTVEHSCSVFREQLSIKNETLASWRMRKSIDVSSVQCEMSDRSIIALHQYDFLPRRRTSCLHSLHRSRHDKHMLPMCMHEFMLEHKQHGLACPTLNMSLFTVLSLPAGESSGQQESTFPVYQYLVVWHVLQVQQHASPATQLGSKCDFI